MDARHEAEAPFGPGAPGFAAFELGARTLEDAQCLAESQHGAVSSAALLRLAVLSLLAAQLARQGRPGAEQDAWASLLQQPDTGALLQRLPAQQRALLQQLLAPHGDAAALAQLPVQAQAQALATLRRLAFALGDPLEQAAAAPRRRRTARLLRGIALAALALAALLALLLRGLSRPNLALHKPVLVETSDPQFAVNPEQVVDGDRSNLGFITLPGGAHSVLIDLQALQPIRSVHVYNRVDCCLERAIPLSLELSSDGQRFQRVAGRARRFALWKARFPPVPARWVRLVHLGGEAFHLSEIEVY